MAHKPVWKRTDIVVNLDTHFSVGSQEVLLVATDISSRCDNKNFTWFVTYSNFWWIREKIFMSTIWKAL